MMRIAAIGEPLPDEIVEAIAEDVRADQAARTATTQSEETDSRGARKRLRALITKYFSQ